MTEHNTIPDQLAIYEDIKKRVNKRFEWRTQFAGHLFAFLAFVVVAPFVFTEAVGVLQTKVGFIVGALWFGGLMIHAVNVVFSELRDRALQNELEKAGIFPGMIRNDKVKHDNHYTGEERLVRLTEDGELIDANDYAYEDNRQHL